MTEKTSTDVASLAGRVLAGHEPSRAEIKTLAGSCLTQREPAPSWTSDVPTEPGWYWHGYRGGPFAAPTWSKDVPTEPGWYWHWFGPEELWPSPSAVHLVNDEDGELRDDEDWQAGPVSKWGSGAFWTPCIVPPLPAGTVEEVEDE